MLNCAPVLFTHQTLPNGVSRQVRAFARTREDLSDVAMRADRCFVPDTLGKGFSVVTTRRGEFRDQYARARLTGWEVSRLKINWTSLRAQNSGEAHSMGFRDKYEASFCEDFITVTMRGSFTNMGWWDLQNFCRSKKRLRWRFFRGHYEGRKIFAESLREQYESFRSP